MQIEFRRLNSLLEMCVARHDDAAVFFSFNLTSVILIGPNFPKLLRTIRIIAMLPFMDWFGIILR